MVQVVTAINLCNKINDGTFSEIYKIKENDKHIVKLLKTNYYKNLNEIIILNKFKSEYIIEIHGITFLNNKLGILLDLADGTLETYKFLSDNNKESAIFNIINGVMWLHNNKFLHLDLKPSNILVKNSRFYISDFSLSIKTENLMFHSETDLISPLYRPYENLKGSKNYSDKSDIWSLGLIIYGILSGKYIDDKIMNVSILGNFNIEMSIIIHIEKMIAWHNWPPLLENSKLWSQYNNYLEINKEKRFSLINITNNSKIKDDIDKLFNSIINNYPNMNKNDTYDFCTIIIMSLYGMNHNIQYINDNLKNYLNKSIEILNFIDFI